MDWKSQIKHSYRDINTLPYHNFTSDEKKRLSLITSRHPMCITPYYYSLIDPQDPQDPIKKMAIPNTGELERSGTYDSSGEAANTILEGVQHKYATTVLLISNHRCAVYCRHCFRKRMVGLSANEVITRVDKAIEYIESDSRINNVLITGGDPLMLDTPLLLELIEKLLPIKQLDYLRIGSRIPVTLPMRIYEDKKLLQMLSHYNESGKRIYLVTHFNHPHEITPMSLMALRALLQAGVIVSNQGVLLKGVNDNAITLTKLMKLLIRAGVQPYYIFQCRPVRGIKGLFQVPLIKGIKIIDQLRKNLDGISKRFRFIMSTKIGKLEIIGRFADEIIIKHHQAKDPRKFNRIYKFRVNKKACWINELEKLSYS